MTPKERQQLDHILRLDGEMKSVDFTVSLIEHLVVDMTEDMHRVDMQRELNRIMDLAYPDGGSE